MTAEAIAPVPKAYESGFLSSTQMFFSGTQGRCKGEANQNARRRQTISTARTRLKSASDPNLHTARTQQSFRSRTGEDEAEEEEESNLPWAVRRAALRFCHARIHARSLRRPRERAGLARPGLARPASNWHESPGASATAAISRI